MTTAATRNLLVQRKGASTHNPTKLYDQMAIEVASPHLDIWFRLTQSCYSAGTCLKKFCCTVILCSTSIAATRLQVKSNRLKTSQSTSDGGCQALASLANACLHLWSEMADQALNGSTKFIKADPTCMVAVNFAPVYSSVPSRCNAHSGEKVV